MEKTTTRESWSWTGTQNRQGDVDDNLPPRDGRESGRARRRLHVHWIRSRVVREIWSDRARISRNCASNDQMDA